MATLVLTLIGDDRAGLVNAVAEVVARHGGNWERSQMAELAGKFAGIVLVTVPDDSVDTLVAALEPLHGMLDITAQPGAVELDVIAPGARRFALDLVGTDRPGIVREITDVLAAHAVNIDTLRTETRDAPMSGVTRTHRSTRWCRQSRQVSRRPGCSQRRAPMCRGGSAGSC